MLPPGDLVHATPEQLEDQMFLHLANLFAQNDFMKRSLLSKRLLEMVILAKVEHPAMYKVLEHKITNQTIFNFISDVVEITELARQSD